MIGKVLNKIEDFIIRHRRITEPLAFVLATISSLMFIVHQGAVASLLLFATFYLGWVLGK